jgi:RimJ/RimL family protein N-acetyltransferase
MKDTSKNPEFNDRSVTIGPAIKEDASGIFNVRLLTWLATYPNNDFGITQKDIHLRLEGQNGELIASNINRWQDTIVNPGDTRRVYVARENNRVVGFTVPTVKQGQRRIGALYILPEAQGKGYGTKLLNLSVSWHGRTEDIYLHAVSYNQKAIQFYKKYGFKITETVIEDEVVRFENGQEIPQLEMVLTALI